MRLHTAWIPAENFVPCLELLAYGGETTLDGGIREAFEGGLLGTDYDGGVWYDLPLGILHIDVALEESGKVFLRVNAPDDFLRAVQVVTLACTSYRLEAD